MLVVLSEGLDIATVRGLPLLPHRGNAGGFPVAILVFLIVLGVTLIEHSRCLVSLSSKSPGLPQHWQCSSRSRLAISRRFNGPSLPTDV